MFIWARQNRWYSSLVVIGLVTATYFIYHYFNPDIPNWITAKVERGDVREVVSVSGFVEAKNTAHLSFPTTGRITDIYVTEGQQVEVGTLLATVGQSRLAAERRAALANVTKAEAARDELVNGQTNEERAVTAATVANARSAWEQTNATEFQKVRNALVALHSNDLTAYSADSEEEATAPTISGSYTCPEEGEYALEIYRSSTDSGYSFSYSGLESGVAAVTTEHPVLIGKCGIAVQFSTDNYADSEWTIPVPNIRSSTYLTYASAVTLAEQQAAQNIQAAKDALILAENTGSKDTAAPRVEALIAANATVAAAQADLAAIDALLSDQSIYAPFAGIIADVDKLPGEIAATEPFITLLAEDAFTITARIPEIDITKINPDQKTTVVFDANSAEKLTGKVTYISPLAVEIDGVAYFEAEITLDSVPEWLRSGLNADIDIIINEATGILRLPSRFVVEENGEHFILVPDGAATKREPVTLGRQGNEGFVEVTSLSEGTTVVAP